MREWKSKVLRRGSVLHLLITDILTALWFRTVQFRVKDQIPHVPKLAMEARYLSRATVSTKTYYLSFKAPYLARMPYNLGYQMGRG